MFGVTYPVLSINKKASQQPLACFNKNKLA
jgi:hypothetical protein